jgi:uncharacterized protein (DUF2062 family)
MKKLKEIAAGFIGMLKAHHAPHEIALGVAIGCFIGMLPLYGFHTLLCVGAALLIPGANRLAILLGTNVSLPPTVATITWTGYDIGRALLAHKHYPPLSWDYIRHLKMSRIGEFYYPLFVGSVVLGLGCALVLYGVTWAIAEHYRKRHAVGP